MRCYLHVLITCRSAMEDGKGNSAPVFLMRLFSWTQCVAVGTFKHAVAIDIQKSEASPKSLS